MYVDSIKAKLKHPSLKVRAWPFKKRVVFFVLALGALIGIVFFLKPGFLLKQAGKIFPNSQIWAVNNGKALYENENPKFKVLLGDSQNPGKPKITYQLKTNPPREITFSLEKIIDSQNNVIVPDFTLHPNLETVVGKKPKLIYREIIPGVDLSYQIKKGKGVKEEIVIREVKGKQLGIENVPITFIFEAQASRDIKPNRNLENIWYFTDEQDNYLWHFEKPFAEDGEDVRGDAELGIKDQMAEEALEIKNYELSISIDTEWLFSPNRTYPIIIDPSIIHDADSDFSGTRNRVYDADTGSSTQFETAYHELPSDEHTVGLWHMNEGGDEIHFQEGESPTSSVGMDGTPSDPEASNGKYAAFNHGGTGTCQDYEDFTFDVTENVSVSIIVRGKERSDSVNSGSYAEAKLYLDPTNGGATGTALGVLRYPSYSSFGWNKWYTKNLQASLSSGTRTIRLCYWTEHRAGASDVNLGIDYIKVITTHTPDSSGNGNDGTIHGAPSVNGRLDSGLNFDGSDDYIAVSNSSSLDLSGGYTIEGWIYFSGWGSEGDDPIPLPNNYVTNGIWVHHSPNGLKPRHGGWSTTCTQHINTLGEWTHEAYTWDGNYWRSYQNGILKCEFNVTNVPAMGANWKIGMLANRYAADDFNHNGYIDEVRISNRALTPEEIKANAQRSPYGIYTSQVIDLGSDVVSLEISWSESGVQTGDGETLYSTTNLVGFWKFNEVSGITAADSSGQENNGTLNVFSDTTGQDVVAGSGWTVANKRWGTGALMFDGTDDYVAVPDDPTLDITDEITMEAWVNTEDTDARIVFKRETTPNNIGYGLSSRAVEFWESDGTGHQPGYLDTLPSGWYHIAGVKENSDTQTTIKLYVNGELKKSQTESLWSIGTNDQPLTLGKGIVGHYLDGIIDSARIYSRALSASEILSNYQAGNIEFQTRTGPDNTPDDGDWEAWKPTTSESQIEDANSVNYFGAYRKPITIDNTGNSNTLTDYQVLVTADTAALISAGKLISNCADIRFADSDLTTPLNYWLESGCNSTSTKLWVKIPSIPGSSTKTVYMYYGNPSATSQSNGDNTFEFFDDFSGDLSKWTNISSGSYSIGIENEEFSASVSAATDQLYHGIMKTNKSFTLPVITEMRWRQVSTHLDDSSSLRWDFHKTNGDSYVELQHQTAWESNGRFRFWEWSWLGTGYLGWTQDTSWHDLRTGWTLTSGKFYLDGSSVLTESYSVTSTAVNLIIGVSQWRSPTGAHSHYDNVRVREYTSPEPTTSVGTESSFTDFWNITNINLVRATTDTTTKLEGTGSMKVQQGASQVDGNTVALWHFEETNGDLAGNDVFDETTNNNDGEFNGTDIATAVVDGIFGKAREFNGSDDYISVSDNPSLGNFSKLTVEVWIKLDSIDNNQRWVSKWGGTGVDRIFIFGPRDGTTDNIELIVGDIERYGVAWSNLNLGEWQHVAGTWDGGTISIYINGKLIGSEGGHSVSIGDGTTALEIGRLGSNCMDGTIDEVRISNVTRTAEEIAEAYRAGRDHRLSRTISSTDLSSKTKLPFYVTADRPGTYLEATVGESAYANYEPDANTVGLWHLEEGDQGNSSIIKFTSTNIAAANAYTYWKTLDDATTLATNDTFEYDVYILNNLGGLGGIDIRFTDATYARGVAGWTDQNSLSCHPGSNISSYTYGKWYHRKCTVPSGLNGKVIDWIDLVNEVDTSTSITAYYDNFIIKNSSGSIKTTIYTQGDPDYNVVDLRSNASNTGNAVQSTYQAESISSADRQGGAFIKDTSGNSNNGTPYGTNLTQGKIGKARNFDGNDYVDMGTDPIGNNEDVTFEAWAYPQGGNYILSSGAQTSSVGYAIIWDNGTFWLGRRTETKIAASGYFGSYSTNQWYHLAGVYDDSAGTLKVYVNGVLYNTYSASSGSWTNAYTNLHIGKPNNTSAYYFNGLIDEVRISNVARSADQIRQEYEIGRRTHPITIDFAAKLDSGNLITGSSDCSFTVDATAYGFEDKGDNLYVGDKIIIKENYGGTKYITQGTVDSVSASTGAVTVSSWDSGSSFPMSGYTQHATVFKWQREWFDITAPLDSHLNTTTRITLRITDGSEGRTFWLDDFRSGGPYLTNSSGSAITSTTQKYFQYRVIFSTTDTAVSPSLISVTLGYKIGGFPPIISPSGGGFLSF